jgi:hypothetical protein
VVSAGRLVTEGDEFRPHDRLTREEAAVALTGAFEAYTGRKLPEGPLDGQDAGTIAPASRKAFAAAVAAGWLDCKDGRYRPADAMTRREVALAVAAVLELPGLPR